MSRPFVSVLIDTYNHERFIEQAIVSVLEQDFAREDREVLVVDDGSTDHTPEIVRKFEPHVRLIRKENGGQASAFNAGIPECKGEIVAFLDGDDWWVREKLSLVVPVFSLNPDVGMVGHGTVKVFPDGSEFTEVLKEQHRFSIRTSEGARLFRMRKSFLGTRTAIRTGILRRILPVPDAIRIEADEFVFTMSAAYGEIQILPQALFHYRLHSDNQYSQNGFDIDNVRKKHRSIAHLAVSLADRLPGTGIGQEAAELIVHSIQVEADQLRLSVDGGRPWETAKTEMAMYKLQYDGPPFGHRIFKFVTLLPALLVPPRRYYFLKRKLASSQLYLKARRVFFPIPVAKHVEHRYGNRN